MSFFIRKRTEFNAINNPALQSCFQEKIDTSVKLLLAAAESTSRINTCFCAYHKHSISRYSSFFSQCDGIFVKFYKLDELDRGHEA